LYAVLHGTEIVLQQIRGLRIQGWFNRAFAGRLQCKKSNLKRISFRVWSEATNHVKNFGGEADLRAEPLASGARDLKRPSRIPSGLERSDKN
jgi:hypothetical protein